MIRRTPEAIVTAHMMDPSRRELFVEGSRDRLFLRWLLGEHLHPNANVIEISAINIPFVDAGGERGRLMAFARWVNGHDVKIRFFADADFDRLLRRAVPRKVWFTDSRDMEWYIVNESCLEKVLKLGVATEVLTALELLGTVQTLGRRPGLLRVLSEIQALELPFQRTDLSRFLRYTAGRLRLDFDGYVQALLQNAGISLRKKNSVLQGVAVLEQQYAEFPDCEIIHGKDAFSIIVKALSRFGAKESEAVKMLWTSFEAVFVTAGSNLKAVQEYLKGSV